MKKYSKKDITCLLEQIKKKGRGGDTQLAHVNPLEAIMLKKMGGSGSINPKTGLREYKGGFFRKPGKALKSVIGGVGGALLGNLMLPGVGGLIGGALGQGAQHAIRDKNPLEGALKGAAMGAALPSAASGLGWGASKLGASGLGSTLSSYGTKNAILPALGFGKDGGSSWMSLGKDTAKTLGGSALLSGMGGGSEKGAGISAGDDTESYLQYLLAKEKEKDNMSFLDKLQDNSMNFLSKPKNLLALGSTGLSLYDRFNQPKPKTAAQEGKELKEKMLAQRLTPEEMAAQEQYELQLEQARRRNARKKFTPEERIDIEPIYSRVSTPGEYRATGRWLNYYNNPQFSGTPIRF
jgi:hypothetical protein